jgi:putative oxidoreductase
MSLFSNLDTWSDEHHPRLLDYIRVLLGLVILFKGIYFISHTDELQSILSKSKFPWVSFIIAHYVALAHLAGGLLIAVGMFTRIAVAFQIPVLLGAVVFVNSSKGFFSESSELAFSLMVLCLLTFYFFYGAGYLSVDHTWRKKLDSGN